MINRRFFILALQSHVLLQISFKFFIFILLVNSTSFSFSISIFSGIICFSLFSLIVVLSSYHHVHYNTYESFTHTIFIPAFNSSVGTSSLTVLFNTLIIAYSSPSIALQLVQLVLHSLRLKAGRPYRYLRSIVILTVFLLFYETIRI